MSQGDFKAEYRTDVNTFLKSPGGKYFFAALIAKETELTVGAAKGESMDLQVKYINQFGGVNFARDLIQRLGEPPVARK